MLSQSLLPLLVLSQSLLPLLVMLSQSLLPLLVVLSQSLLPLLVVLSQSLLPLPVMLSQSLLPLLVMLSQSLLPLLVMLSQSLHVSTRQSTYYMPNIEVRSRNHFLTWKSNKCYIFWVCVSSLSYPSYKANAPYYIVMCGLSGSTLSFHIIS
jgi:hypothetical protein